MRFTLLLLLYNFGVTRQSCSWQVCNAWSNDEGVINVHLVPHTHDDLGWIKTVDQYYYGADPSPVPVGVQYIYNTVLNELEKNPERRFSFAETGFLWRWYNDHDDFHKHQLQKLVKTGQIELIGGGWVQNDEATSHYIDIIDQMTLGLKKLELIFGECGKPTVAWQIDPFGHSKEQANLFAMMGYRSLFFARLHYLEKEMRLKNRTLEFLWNPSEDLKTQIFTGVFFQDDYGPPSGLCFDALCRDDPIMDNPDLEGYNLDAKISTFVYNVKRQASFLRSSHVMLLMGSDFHYTNANTWYTNLDKLIHHVNNNNSLGVRVFYSTPSCYVKGVTESSSTNFSTKTDDFFPYASSSHSYWTGYFTSRPTFKRMIREASSLLQLCKQLDALADLGPEDLADVEKMERASALVQHHDAVTGTAKEHVTKDYEKRLYKSFKEGETVINDYLKKVYPKKDIKPPKHVLCELLNETVCEPLRNVSTFAVTVFNSNSRQFDGLVRVPYYSRQAIVMNGKGDHLQVQVMKTFSISSFETNYRAPYELIIPAKVGPLGYTTYIVDNSTSIQVNKQISSVPITAKKSTAQQVSIENEEFLLLFDENGLLSELVEKRTNTQHKFHQKFFYYQGVMNGSQPSGAYIFRPDGDALPIGSAKLEVVKGPLVNEVRQTFNSWVSQTIRLKRNAKHIEFDWVIGPIPKEWRYPVTKEVITRYTTDINHGGVFYTDSNGRQMIRRQNMFNPSFEYVNSEPVAGNYYPITNRVYINNNNVQMTVLTDRSEGVTSIDGGLEIMLHRRCFVDDHWGVEEALDELGSGKGLVARGVHHVLFGSSKSAAMIHRPLAVDIFHYPHLAFTQVNDVGEYMNNYNMEFSAMQRSLPESVHLMTLEKWQRKSLLIRLEHIFETNDGVNVSTPVVVDLKDLFTPFTVVKATELKLAANRNISSTSHWTNSDTDSTITLKPMEIRTFNLDVNWI